ncbi:hypothetical protein EON79_16815 [bacterium]|nr:MAG: hypothetical protein EON79_16815 [bacterium]
MQDIPYNTKAVLQFPLLLCVVAAFIYLFAYISYRNRGRLPITRFLAHIFAILGIAAGSQQLWNMLNPNTGFLYRETVSKYAKIYYAHYAAPAIPFLVLMFIIIADLRIRKAAKAEALEDEDF